MPICVDAIRLTTLQILLIMDNLKEQISRIDLKLTFKDLNQKIHYKEMTRELFPELFDKITIAVEESLNKQMKEINETLEIIENPLDHK